MRILEWIGSSLRDLKGFPDEVMGEVGHALYFAQIGLKHKRAKPLKGFAGAGILEVVEDYSGDTYRAVYTVQLKHAVYVLHCFQKKSHKGGQVPRPDKDLIETRLKAAIALDRSRND